MRMTMFVTATVSLGLTWAFFVSPEPNWATVVFYLFSPGPTWAFSFVSPELTWVVFCAGCSPASHGGCVWPGHAEGTPRQPRGVSWGPPRYLSSTSEMWTGSCDGCEHGSPPGNEPDAPNSSSKSQMHFWSKKMNEIWMILDLLTLPYIKDTRDNEVFISSDLTQSDGCQQTDLTSLWLAAVTVLSVRSRSCQWEKQWRSWFLW